MTISPHPHMIRWYQIQKYLASLLCLISSLALTPPFFAKKKLIFFSSASCEGDQARMQDPGFLEDLGGRILGGAGASWRQQAKVQRATGGCLGSPPHSYSGLNTAPAHSRIKSQEFEMFFLHSSETSFVSSEINHATLCHSMYQVWPRHIIP